MKAVADGKDSGEGGDGFLGSIFLIADDENDALAVRGSRLSGVDCRTLLCKCGDGNKKRDGASEQTDHAVIITRGWMAERGGFEPPVEL